MARPKTKSEPYRVRVPLELEKVLHRLADRDGITPGAYLGRWITRHLKSNENLK